MSSCQHCMILVMSGPTASSPITLWLRWISLNCIASVWLTSDFGSLRKRAGYQEHPCCICRSCCPYHPDCVDPNRQSCQAQECWLGAISDDVIRCDNATELGATPKANATTLGFSVLTAVHSYANTFFPPLSPLDCSRYSQWASSARKTRRRRSGCSTPSSLRSSSSPNASATNRLPFR